MKKLTLYIVNFLRPINLSTLRGFAPAKYCNEMFTGLRKKLMVPGATQSSGYTQRLIDNAMQCDQTRILARLQAQGVGCQNPLPTGALNAVNASVLELMRQQSCQISGTEAALLPKAGVPEGVRIQNRIDETIRCAQPTGPTPNRFLFHYPAPVITVCPPPTAEELNSTQPMAPMIGCQPSRFF